MCESCYNVEHGLSKVQNIATQQVILVNCDLSSGHDAPTPHLMPQAIVGSFDLSSKQLHPRMMLCLFFLCVCVCVCVCFYCVLLLSRSISDHYLRSSGIVSRSQLKYFRRKRPCPYPGSNRDLLRDKRPL